MHIRLEFGKQSHLQPPITVKCCHQMSPAAMGISNYSITLIVLPWLNGLLAFKFSEEKINF